MQKQLTRLSVHTFIEQALSGGDLIAAGGSFGRMQEGTRMHQRMQREAGPALAAEVPVVFRRESELSVLEIGGRMDGWRADGSVPTVVEIKTTFGDVEALGDGLDEHWAQARVYGAIRCLQDGYERVGVELMYVGLPDAVVRTLRREYDGRELAGWFLELCDTWLRSADDGYRYRARRDDILAGLSFPFDDFRPGQREMAGRVFRTVRDGGLCMVQAPTGIGKTMAALYPALKALGEGHCGRIFYLTARTTVKGIAEEALERLARRGAALRSVTLTAKEKCCPNPGVPCHPAWCSRAAGFFDRLGAALGEVEEQPRHWDRDGLEDLADRHRLCPFELSLSVSQRCDVVVCDYNYAFDPRVYLRRFFEEPGDSLLLVDEAHNLVDRARDMFSAELQKPTVMALLRLMKGKPAGDVKALKKAASGLNRVLVAVGKNMAENKADSWVYEEPPPELVKAARKLMQTVEPMLGVLDREPFAEAMVDLYFECRTFCLVAEGYDECCTVYAKGGRSRTLVRIYCMDPSTRLEAVYQKVRAAVFFSASLTPFAYFRRLLGAAEADTLALSTPFPPENLCVLMDPVTSTAYRHREDTLPRVAEALYRLIDGRGGHYMAFFPSYRYMERVHALFTGLYPDRDTLVQRPGMGEREREEFLGQFDAEARPLLAFVVMGGFFGEGVDLAGDRLIGAAVVGVGLPQICIERDLIRRYHAGQGEDGYAFAYQLPGFIRVVQAAGRVIRTAQDRGVVLLIDPRFARWDVREMMPEWWEPVQAVDGPRELSRALMEFW